MFLLDTNVISELRPGKAQPCALVLQWAGQQIDQQFYMSSVTLLELELGIQRLEARPMRQGEALRRWLEQIKVAYASRILPFAAKTAVLCASLHLPDPRSERDAMIAAVALEHSFAVVTRNTKDFEGAGLVLINPWLPKE
jgi:toxin FitB